MSNRKLCMNSLNYWRNLKCTHASFAFSCNLNGSLFQIHLLSISCLCFCEPNRQSAKCKLENARIPILHIHSVHYVDVLNVLSSEFLLICIWCIFPSHTPRTKKCTQISDHFSLWSRFSVLWVCLLLLSHVVSTFLFVYAFWTRRLSASHSPHWETAALTKPQRGQQVESTEWVGKNGKREVNRSFPSYSVTTAVNMLMQHGCDPPPTLHLFHVLCVTLVLYM